MEKQNMPSKIGQHFLSQSKIQDHPVHYIYGGRLTNGYHKIFHSSQDPFGDLEVETEWFHQRKIHCLLPPFQS